MITRSRDQFYLWSFKGRDAGQYAITSQRKYTSAEYNADMYAFCDRILNFCKYLPCLVLASVLSIKITKLTETVFFSLHFVKISHVWGKQNANSRVYWEWRCARFGRIRKWCRGWCAVQLLERKLSSSEVDRRINAIVAPLATQLVTLIQSVMELSERSFNRSTEGKALSKRSKSSS